VTVTPPETGDEHTPETGDQNLPETGNSGAAETGATAAETGAESTDLQAEVLKWREMARKNEASAKANADAAKELAKLKRQGMGETERAVAEAVAARESELRIEYGAQLARSALAEALGDRLPADAKAALLDGIDYGRFLDDGDVDTEAVAAFATKAIPETKPGQLSPDLGQGARPLGAANGADDPFTRALRSKVGLTRPS
jgi:hypothetical protein